MVTITACAISKLALFNARQRLEANAGSAFDAELLPCRHRGERGVDQCLRFAHGILDFERNAVRRMFAGKPADAARLIEFELAPGMAERGGLAFVICGLAVDLRTGLLRVGAPETARAHRLERAVQNAAMFLK